jgi:hypothetical protein
VIAAILFGLTAFLHIFVTGGLFTGVIMNARIGTWVLLALILVTFSLLEGITWAASKLTNWEATYRGLRMPIGAVRRGMYYHAAHYLPVGLVALSTVGTYAYLRSHHVLSRAWDERYLYVLAGEVIVAAVYLFQTYWIGMRNMMYANR